MLSSKMLSASVRNIVRQMTTATRPSEPATSKITKTLIPGVEVEIEESDKCTNVKSFSCPTYRENLVVETPLETSNHSSCSLCRLNLRNLNHTDVLILEQFIGPDGRQYTQVESKLCSKQYHNIRRLIRQARRCNLIKREQDYFNPGPWHDLNTYIEPDRKRDQPMKVIKKQYWR